MAQWVSAANEKGSPTGRGCDVGGKWRNGLRENFAKNFGEKRAHIDGEKGNRDSVGFLPVDCTSVPLCSFNF